MTQVLRISVEFLTGTFHGRMESGPEWPPSPMRLFQALTAAAAARWPGEVLNEEAVLALRWLAEQDPPVIIAPRVRFGTKFRIAVPNNDLDIVAAAWQRDREPPKSPAELRTMKEVAPVYVPDETRVHYIWEALTPLSEALAATLSGACRSVTHLGWGADLTACHMELSVTGSDQVAPNGSDRWAPVASGNRLRTPRADALRALQERHVAFLNRLSGGYLSAVPPLDPAAYERTPYALDSDMLMRPWAAFELRALDGNAFRPFDPIRSSIVVAAMVRHATSSAAQRSGWSVERINTQVHGHTPDGTAPGRFVSSAMRFGYMPLPTMEGRTDDARRPLGMIRRVLISGSAGMDGEVAWAERVLSGTELIDERSGAPIALLQPAGKHDWVVARYVAQSNRWVSATPVLLPGFNDHDPVKTEKLIRKSLLHAGVPPVLARNADVEWSPAALYPGSDAAWRYRRPSGLLDATPTHVRITWRDPEGAPLPLTGPFAFGSGRFRGLGVMVAD